MHRVKEHGWPIIALAALVVALASVAVPSSTLQPRSGGTWLAVTAGGAALRAYGSRGSLPSRSAPAAKLDGALADLVRHADLARPDHLLYDLHAMSPAARFTQSSAAAAPLVLVDAVTAGDPQRLAGALIALGLQHASVYANDVGGWLPVAQIMAAAGRAELLSMRAAMPHSGAGAVSSQGDYAQGSDSLRLAYPTLTGAGVMVGVLSDSYDCYAVYAEPDSGVPASGYSGYAFNGKTADAQTDVATGALPAGVDVLAEAQCLQYGAPYYPPFTDEGRAMMQIVHDVAPGASLAFYTTDDSEADFASGIGALATAGATVEADDTRYYDEPFYQDGILAEAVDAVEAKGVAYFSAAGNDSDLAYENVAPMFTTLSSGATNSGEYLLNFDTSGATNTTALPVTIPALAPGEFLAIVVQWDQPYVTGAPRSGGAQNQIDLCVTGASGYLITDLDNETVTCTGANDIGHDPVQLLIIGNPADAADFTPIEHLNFSVGLANGTTAPGRIMLAVEDDGAGSTIDAFATHSATIQGHPGATGAVAVGAAFFANTPRCGATPAVPEFYSSYGGAPILFDSSGVRLATPLLRQKPDVVGPDGVNTTFFGFTLAKAGISDPSTVSACQNDPDYPNFFGTSAATPHVAAIAALMRQANGALTPTQMYAALRASASPMPVGGSSPNVETGYGFVDATAALALLPPGPPALSLASSTVTLGETTTLSWSSINASSCTASGAWSGSEATSGSLTLTPAAVGALTYSLACANAQAKSTAASVTLTVSAVPSSHGGGGGFDALTLVLLAALGCMRWTLRAMGAARGRGGSRWLLRAGVVRASVLSVASWPSAP
jgi:subtilisin family serine protease